MRVLVLGAGVVGLTTALFLRREGHEVLVVDGNDRVGAMSSFANGGQLSYSYVAPLAGPGVLGKVPGWLLRRDAPMRMRPTADLDQWRWCLRFVRACSRERSDATTRRLLALSFLSRDLLNGLLQANPELDFSHARTGKLVVHRDPESFEAAYRLLDYQRSLGCVQQAVDAAGCVQIEPALAQVQPSLAGGIFTPSEESGDCLQFCCELERLLRAQGVQFQFDTRVQALRRERDARVVVVAQTGVLPADHVVVASGAASARLLQPLGIRVPIYPLKGYSLTLPIRVSDGAPRVSVTDFQRKVVYARLGDRLRVAGMADLTGRDNDLDPARVDTLRREALAMFPQAGDYDQAEAWAGLRPATPEGTPLIGATPVRNLWINVGQGALGFTLAMGSAKLLADRFAGRAGHTEFALGS